MLRKEVWSFCNSRGQEIRLWHDASEILFGHIRPIADRVEHIGSAQVNARYIGQLGIGPGCISRQVGADGSQQYRYCLGRRRPPEDMRS